MKRIILCVLVLLAIASAAFGNALLNVLMLDSGTITGITLTNAAEGCDYEAGTYYLWQGSNNTATVTVTVDGSCYPSGDVTSVTLLSGGSGYAIGSASIGVAGGTDGLTTVSIDSIY